MHLSTSKAFIQSAARDFKRTGAVIPSSRALAQAMTNELVRNYRQPAVVLEVGGGTGSITQEIVRHIGDGDRLDVYEIDPRLATLLKTRVRDEEMFQNSEALVRIHNRAIETIKPIKRYDFVISCLPFTNFKPGVVKEIFEIYRKVLKPGGVCSFYEYFLVRKAARLISNSAERERVAEVSNVVRSYVCRYSYGSELVLRNLPPAMVYHIRFDR